MLNLMPLTYTRFSSFSILTFEVDFYAFYAFGFKLLLVQINGVVALKQFVIHSPDQIDLSPSILS